MKTFNIGDTVRTPDGVGKLVSITSNRRQGVIQFPEDENGKLETKTYNITTLNKG